MAPPAPLLERLRQRGWRLTPQRRAVAEVLTGEHVHLTADDVHARAQQSVPEVSLATVYNTLNELVALGEVLEVRAARGPSRYDPNVAPAHHHLVCTSCGALFDVRPRGLRGVHLKDEEQRGFRIDEVDITFRGRCPDCA
jgi:Fur family ferric uptake transcriptional regulator